MRLALPRVLLCLPLLGCPPTPPPGATPPPWCEGPTSYRYAPSHGGELTTFPDDHWTLPDPSSMTGLRIHMEADQTTAAEGVPENYRNVFDELSTLDGFGLLGGVIFRFNNAIDPLSVSSDSAAIVAQSAAGPRRIPVDVHLTDDDMTVILVPRQPLPPASQAAAMIWGARDRAGACVAPGQALRELLHPESELDEGFPAHVFSPRFVTAMEFLDLRPEQVNAATVWTTQSATRVGDAVASTLADKAASVLGPLLCVPETERMICDGLLAVADFRGPDGLVPRDSEGEVLGTYDLPVRVWLPGDGQQGPYPTVLFGHGLGGDRSQGGAAADRLCPLGIAVVAADAVEHGDHPGRTEAPLSILDPLMLFGIGFGPPSISGLKLRDNFRQSAWERMQLVDSLVAGADINGDGGIDFDAGHLAYIGVSLGSLMGPELLAQRDDFQGALLAVGGGRITSIIQESSTFAPLISLMAPPESPQGDIDRFFPMLQTLVEAADAGVWAPRVLQERGAGRPLPQILAEFAFADEIVPNAANEVLMRALGVPGVGREVWEVSDLEFVSGPLSANLADGGTAGTLLFDEIHDPTDPEPATHDNVTTSVEGWQAASAFLLPVLEGGIGTISDPYLTR